MATPCRVTKDEIIQAFHSEESLKAYAKRIHIAPCTLRQIWLQNYGNEAIKVRGRKAHARTQKRGTETGMVDEMGHRYGHLLVIERVLSKSLRTKALWRCRCDCGQEAIYEGSQLRAGSRRSCGCRATIRGNKSPRWTGCDCGLIPGSYLTSLRVGATNRDLGFNVTAEDLCRLLKAQGHKCALTGEGIGFEPGTQLKIKGGWLSSTASLDRIDSSKGYDIGNLQWVHKDLQWMKSDMPQGMFLDICRRVAKHNP